MEYKYLVHSELQKKVEKGLGEDDPPFITSISDLITIIEKNSKSGALTCNSICNIFDKHADSGKIYLAEVDQDSIINALFQDQSWASFTNKKMDPIHIVRHLSLIKYSDAIWWDDNIYTEMKSLFNEDSI